MRIAGKVDKNTLKQPYHAELMKAVDAFISSNSVSVSKPGAKSMTETHDLGHYAQLLLAAQITRDAAEAETEKMRARVDALEEEVRTLRTELSASRPPGADVLPIRKTLSEELDAARRRCKS